MTAAHVDVQGICLPAFEEVRAAFADNFAVNGEVGASVSVILDGETVVDLWGGFANAARSAPWRRESIVTTYSATKGFVALCAHICADRGLLDFDAPMSRYWPEFARNGKDGVLVRHVLTHTAGIPAITEPLPTEAIFDWQRMVHALEDAPLLFEPGTTMIYHSVTYGFLVGELIRRVTGRTVGTFLREEVTGPLGAEYFIGFGAELDDRVVETIAAPPETDNLARYAAEPDSLQARIYHNPPAHNTDRRIPNTRAWRGAEIPSVNGHGNARGMARIYGALARGGSLGGVTLLSPAAVERCATIQVEMDDALSGRPVARCLGFTPIAGWPGAFGHSGQGGSLGFADPASKMGFAYVPNQMRFDAEDPRRVVILQAVRNCLDAARG